ncbi:MAG: MFS transporter [Actinobacteria bacterium]|nr:MFS transporter [Actinomycetota bacterium]
MQTIDKADTHPAIRPNFKTVTLLSVCHVINDSYMNLFPPLLPFIIPALGLSVSAVGWLMTFFSVTSSLSQLAIGYLTDRLGGRFFILLGPLVAAIFMSSIGLINNYVLMAIALSLAGLGIAAFHPPASALVGSIAESRSGRAMSLFTLGGNLGWAVMPLLAVPLVSKFGLTATPVLAIPGLIAIALLYTLAPPLSPGHPDANSSFMSIIRVQPRVFLCLLGTVAFRSLSFFGLITFLPKFLSDHGFSPVAGGMLLSILALSGALGGLLGGFLSDSWGRKPIIIGSLFLTVPFLNIFLLSSGWLMSLWMALAGASLLASFSVTVVAAQEIFPDNKAVASSLALGFGLGLGGLGVGLIGMLADSVGLDRAIAFISFLPMVAAAFAFGLPGRRNVDKFDYGSAV